MQQSQETIIALLQEQCRNTAKELDSLKAAVRAIEEQDDKRVRAGLVGLGAIVITLLGTIGSLGVYIFNKATG